MVAAARENALWDIRMPDGQTLGETRLQRLPVLLPLLEYTTVIGKDLGTCTGAEMAEISKFFSGLGDAMLILEAVTTSAGPQRH